MLVVVISIHKALAGLDGVTQIDRLPTDKISIHKALAGLDMILRQIILL